MPGFFQGLKPIYSTQPQDLNYIRASGEPKL